MNYLYCKQMNNQLCFNKDFIYACTVGNNTKQNTNLIIREKYNGELLDLEAFFDEREKIKENARNGEIIETCQGCHYLEMKDWDKVENNRKIGYILVSNYQKCNSRCIYCISRVDYNPREKYVCETYNIVPVIEDMFKKGYVTQDTVFDFAGGECTLYEKFEELLSKLIDFGVKEILIHTNAIIYSKAIETGIKKGVVSICISPDSARRSTHKKVKGVDTYNTVWDNIKKYSKANALRQGDAVCLKYIIVEGVNDNKEEIELWLKRVKAFKIPSVRFNADNNIFINYQNRSEYNHHYLANIVVLTEFCAERAKHYNLIFKPDYNVEAAYKMLNIRIPR